MYLKHWPEETNMNQTVPLFEAITELQSERQIYNMMGDPSASNVT